jgi:DNA-binding transcriptional LysR family regulator|tara:strand:+ start:315 stop:1277 length:963 start_codon:yes stop_codon:yes gene_type:complete
MDISTRHLRCFLTVARLKSFTQAANELNVSQPSLSVTIQRLEEMLGTQLFDRNRRKVSLTAVGQEFLGVANRLLSDFENSIAGVREVIDRRRGVFHVASVPSVSADFLPRALETFLAQYPGLNFVLYDAFDEPVGDLVALGNVDVGLGHSQTEDGRHDNQVVTKPIFRDRMVVVCRKDHPLNELKKVSWRDLVSYEFIHAMREMYLRNLVNHQFASIGHVVLNEGVSVNIFAAGGLIAQGFGITVLPRLSLPLIGHSDIMTAIPIEDPPVFREINIITRSEVVLSPSAHSFRQHLFDFTNDWIAGTDTVQSIEQSISKST